MGGAFGVEGGNGGMMGHLFGDEGHVRLFGPRTGTAVRTKGRDLFGGRGVGVADRRIHPTLERLTDDRIVRFFGHVRWPPWLVTMRILV